MQEVFLLKMGEITLKGQNRSSFENLLMKNIRRRLKGVGPVEIQKAQSTLYVQPGEGVDLDEVQERLGRVFGVVGISRSAVVPKEYEAIRQTAVQYLGGRLEEVSTFKVRAKRADKHFALTSPQICERLGEDLLAAFPHLQVDVHTPQLTVTVEVRDFAAYVHPDQQPGAGGIPVGCGGRGALLISGGIDSPVAGYMMAKRGLELMGVHFASPPYTSDRARLKVLALCRQLARYCGRMQVAVVPFTEIQEQIAKLCPEEYFTLVMRRFMMEIADRLALQGGCGCLITGESVGQVASQTLPALACTDPVSQLPVLRPVIGMDKEEIVAIARKIGTFETSVLPYEDCCTVFTPRHPRTRPQLAQVLEAEKRLDRPALIERALAGVQMFTIEADTQFA